MLTRHLPFCLPAPERHLLDKLFANLLHSRTDHVLLESAFKNCCSVLWDRYLLSSWLLLGTQDQIITQN